MNNSCPDDLFSFSKLNSHESNADKQNAASNIQGLSYFPNYINLIEEGELIKIIDNQIWQSDLSRRVQHYGYKYDYKIRNITKDSYLGDIPRWLMDLGNKLLEDKIFLEKPNQIIINEYQSGQGISSHIDLPEIFGDIIASLSLGSDIVMDFAKDDLKIPLLLAQRSLVVIKNEARYKWRHAIAKRKADYINDAKIVRGRRISVTFRNVL